VDDIEISASVGRIEEIRRLDGGAFAARYVPPPQLFPQVAILAVIGRVGGAIASDGWVALPLSGQADLRVRMRPGARIALRVGERTFGPALARANGIAPLHVVVPPGVREAHHGFRPVDLKVPETSLLHVVGDRSSVRADVPAEVRVLAYVVAPHGAARRGDVPAFEPTRGTVVVAAREAGAFDVRWRLPPGSAGEQRLVVRLAGSAASRSVLRVATVAGPPATVSVSFDREAVVAGGPGEVAVTARVLDAAGNPTHARVELDAEPGVLAPASERGPGVYEARWTVPSRFAGRAAGSVTARAPEPGIAGSRTIALVPAAPTEARFVPGDEIVRSGGGREASLRVVVTDRFENPVAGLASTGSAARGRVVSVAPGGGGAYLVRYVPPAASARTDDRVEVEVGGLHAVTDVLVVPPRGGASFTAEAGFLEDARGRFGGPRLGIAVERPIAASGPVSLRAEAAWASLDRPGRGSLATLLAGASVGRDRGAASFWASASAGAALAGGDEERWKAAAAAHVAAGVGIRRSWGTPFAEVGLVAAGPAARDTGSFAAVVAAVGIRLDTNWLAPSSGAAATGGVHADAAHRR
jgi:hypothetical protein